MVPPATKTCSARASGWTVSVHAWPCWEHATNTLPWEPDLQVILGTGQLISL